MNNKISCVKQTSQISEIYPDISQELCDKHSKLLSKLHNTFGDVYDQFQPEGFVIVNGIAKVLQLGKNMEVNFAIENGVTILYAKTYLNSEFFINGNQHCEQIEFDSSGKHVEGIHQKIHEIKQLFEQCMLNKKNKQYYGGIIYIYSNIGDKHFSYHQCLMLGLLITILSILDQLQQYSKTDLINMLKQIDKGINLQNLNNILNNYQINKCNIYNQHQIHLQVPQNINTLQYKSIKSIKTIESIESIKCNRQKNHQIFQNPTSNDSLSSLEENSDNHHHNYLDNKEIIKIQIPQAYKLIICQLDVAQEEILAYYNKNKQLISLSREMESHYNIKESINCLSQTSLHDYLAQNKSLVDKLRNKAIGFEKYIKFKHLLDLKYFIYDEGLTQLLGRIAKAAPFLQNYCVLEGTALLISIQKYRYAETMCFLRKLLNSNVLSTTKYLHSKNSNLQLQGYGRQIGEVMYTSLPSVGCAVFKAGVQNFEIIRIQ